MQSLILSSSKPSNTAAQAGMLTNNSNSKNPQGFTKPSATNNLPNHQPSSGLLAPLDACNLNSLRPSVSGTPSKKIREASADDNVAQAVSRGQRLASLLGGSGSGAKRVTTVGDLSANQSGLKNQQAFLANINPKACNNNEADPTSISAFKPIENTLQEGHGPVKAFRVAGANNNDAAYMNKLSSAAKQVADLSRQQNNASQSVRRSMSTFSASGINQMNHISSTKGGINVHSQNQKSMMKPDAQMVSRLLLEETDERYCFLLRHGVVHFIETESNTIFVELKQIPNTWIVYRRPAMRMLAPEKVLLEQRGLKHIPLLEGEEKVKMLSLARNEIFKIENLVSMPALMHLDLSENLLTEIVFSPTITSSLQQLRFLILQKNRITRVKNIDGLVNLESLDLSQNRIKDIETLHGLNNLRHLNLSSNMIESVKLPEMQLSSLVELNFKRNMITNLEGQSGSLQKLFLSFNNIQKLENLKLPSVVDLQLDNNPIETRTQPSKDQLKSQFPCLVFLNQQKLSTQQSVEKPARSASLGERQPSSVEVTATPAVVAETTAEADKNAVQTPREIILNDGPVEIRLPVFKPKNECNVIKIIQKEWDRETQRLNQRQNQKIPGLGEKSLVQSGHAEIEGNRILYIYGNALEVLQRSEFYDLVEELHLNYVRFDLIVYHATLQKLKRFTKLKRLVLSNNHLNSFILLSKIECLTTVSKLQIYDNEIMRCIGLKSFVVYRFQHIKNFNGCDLDQDERRIAKQQFQLFDKILSVQNVFTRKTPAQCAASGDPIRRHELRQESKKNGENAAIIAKDYIKQVIRTDEAVNSLENSLDNFMKGMVMEIAHQMDGPRQFEKQMKAYARGK